MKKLYILIIYTQASSKSPCINCWYPTNMGIFNSREEADKYCRTTYPDAWEQSNFEIEEWEVNYDEDMILMLNRAMEKVKWGST